MTEHKTFPGKVYTVSCAEDTTVVLPDPLGVKEAVVLECTAGAQLHVTATAGRLETSSDQAIVTELFKLAPRTKLHLLMGGAGGWLPAGFTELEYLESSGTQYIDTGIVTDGKYTISARMQLFASSRDVWGRRSNNGNEEGNAQPYGNSVLNTYDETKVVINYVWRGYNRNSPFDLKQPHDYVVTEGQKAFIVDGVSQTISSLNSWTVKAVNLDNLSHFLFWSNVSNSVTRLGKALASIYSFRMQDGEGRVVLDFVPVLNAEGVPGMFDRVSKQFFENIGTGSFGYRIKRKGETVAPMSLRDPWRVAPSGVYARLIAENEIEIVADTEEVQGDGWEWFTNTSEAYEYYGIKQEEFLTE